MSSTILERGAGALLYPLLVFAAYLLFTGHHTPGGGFVGGLVAAAALVLRARARGYAAVRAVLPCPASELLGVGLGAALAATAIPTLTGREWMDHVALEVVLPVFGTVKASTVLLFDAGVLVVVVGLVVAVLESFEAGEEP